MIQIKKENNNNKLLNLLFQSKNIYGESLNDTNKDILPFIFGIRHNYTIINIKNVSFFLKRIFNLINFIIKKKEKILIICNADEIQFLANQHFIKKNKNLLLYDKEWINGVVTNKLINNSFDKKIHFLLQKNKIKLILVLKSSIDEKFLNTELFSLKIPIISLINTGQDIKKITYPIITNTKNIKSLYSLMYLLRKIF